MPETTHIINAFPLVADALGRKYGVKVHIGGQEAYTNGKDIHIPGLPIDADETVLNLARGFLDHEAAHLRITDSDALKEAKLTEMEHHVWNIVEDFMVEKQLAAMYPGCRENFIWLNKHLFLTEADRPGGDESPPASVIFKWLLISLYALTVPELENERARLVKAMDQHYPALRQQLEPIVRTIPTSCITTRDCIAMARTIVSLLKGYAASQKPEKANEKEEDRPDNSASANAGSDAQNAHDQQSQGQGREESTPDSTESPDKGADKEVSNAENQPHAPDVDENDKHSEGSANGGNVSNDDKDTAADSLQEILDDPTGLASLDIGGMLGKRLEDIHRHGISTRLAVAVSRPSTGLPLSASEVADIRKSTTALRTRLNALLQAQVLVRNRTGRVGRVDMRRLARIAVNEARIFARRGIKQGINTAIHILMDASDSMRYNSRITLACHACHAVADALQHIPGVGVAVTSFPNGSYSQGGREPVEWASVAPILSHKQKIHPRFKRPCNGGTPMAQAVWWVLRQLWTLQEERKIILLLSDGLPDSVPEAQHALKQAYALGFEVMGLGIQDNNLEWLLSPFGMPTRTIHNLPDLAPAMFDMLQQALLRRP